MRILPPDVEGANNDLQDLIEHYAERALNDPQIKVSAVGAHWEDSAADNVFKEIDPSVGQHDIHMNQGNEKAKNPGEKDHTDEDGIWQDGGLFFHLPAPENRTAAFFFAFQNQTFNTDEEGHAIIDHPLPVVPAVKILAALVNPTAPEDAGEQVLLLNESPDPVDLSGWLIADKAKQTCAVPAGPLAGGATLEVPIVKPCALSNQGGIISLLDGSGTKVSGVSYTKAEAEREGWTLAFQGGQVSGGSESSGAA